MQPNLEQILSLIILSAKLQASYSSGKGRNDNDKDRRKDFIAVSYKAGTLVTLYDGYTK